MKKYGPQTKRDAEVAGLEQDLRDATDIIRLRVRDRELVLNEKRHSIGRPILSARVIMEMAEVEAAREARALRKKFKASTTAAETRAAHVPMASMQCEWAEVAQVQPRGQIQTQKQKGQVG